LQHKEKIQDLFKNEIGSLVNRVKPGGSGMSNDGNIDRSCFFFNYRKSARITGVDENLILRFYVTLQSIS